MAQLGVPRRDQKENQQFNTFFQDTISTLTYLLTYLFIFILKVWWHSLNASVCWEFIIVLFTLPTTLWATLPFYKWVKWGAERWGKLLHIPQLVNDKDGIRTPIRCSPSHLPSQGPTLEPHSPHYTRVRGSEDALRSDLRTWARAGSWPARLRPVPRSGLTSRPAHGTQLQGLAPQLDGEGHGPRSGRTLGSDPVSYTHSEGATSQRHGDTAWKPPSPGRARRERRQQLGHLFRSPVTESQDPVANT